MTPDLINALFEACGAVLVLLSIHRLHRDKLVRGVHWAPVLFFTAWGVWNLFYYPHLRQLLSFRAGICLALVNAIWLAQLLYYLKAEQR